jgi:3-methylfumaryl-CoA hydratase
LPPGWSDLFFGSLHRPDNMRPDGQAAKSSWMPANPFSMIRIGGDRTEFPGDIRIGDELRRVTKINEVTVAGTAEAPILRMVQRSETSTPRGIAAIEDREFVYFDKHGPASEAALTLPQAVWRRTLNPDPVLLFRYSALRFNSHRIHYDRKYAMEEEGAPGLIVQSSLLGQLLIELCRAAAPDRSVAAIRRVNRQVVFDTGPITLCAAPSSDGKSASIWVLDQKGALAIHGDVTFR